MAAVIPVAALLPIQDVVVDRPAEPRFYRVCLRHEKPLEEVVLEGLNDVLRCPGPAPRPRFGPGQPPGTHRATVWGVFDGVKGRVVAVGTKDRIVLLDDFDYPRDKILSDLIECPELTAEVASAAVTRPPVVQSRQERGVKLTRALVTALKAELGTPGWRIKDILVRYDISQAALYQIRKGTMWASVAGPVPVPPEGFQHPKRERGPRAPRPRAVRELTRKTPAPGSRTWRDLSARDLASVRELAATQPSTDVALLFGVSSTDVLKIKHGMVGC